MDENVHVFVLSCKLSTATCYHVFSPFTSHFYLIIVNGK